MHTGKKIPLLAALYGLCLFDSFLIDPFLLAAIGMVLYAAVARTASRPAHRIRRLKGLAIATLILFWLISISLYLNLGWIVWMWKLCGAASGRDWMLNSGVFHFEYAHPSILAHLISGLIFATYPLWLYLGIRLGAGLHSRSRREKRI